MTSLLHICYLLRIYAFQIHKLIHLKSPQYRCLHHYSKMSLCRWPDYFSKFPHISTHFSIFTFRNLLIICSLIVHNKRSFYHLLHKILSLNVINLYQCFSHCIKVLNLIISLLQNLDLVRLKFIQVQFLLNINLETVKFLNHSSHQLKSKNLCRILRIMDPFFDLFYL